MELVFTLKLKGHQFVAAKTSGVISVGGAADLGGVLGSHLESVLYLLSEMMDVTVLDCRSLRFSLGGEVDAGVSLILTLAHSWGLG